MTRDESIRAIEAHYGFPEDFEAADYTDAGLEKLANQQLMESNASVARLEASQRRQR